MWLDRAELPQLHSFSFYSFCYHVRGDVRKVQIHQSMFSRWGLGGDTVRALGFCVRFYQAKDGSCPDGWHQSDRPWFPAIVLLKLYPSAITAVQCLSIMSVWVCLSPFVNILRFVCVCMSVCICKCEYTTCWISSIQICCFCLCVHLNSLVFFMPAGTTSASKKTSPVKP